MTSRTKKSTTIAVVESDQVVQHILPKTAKICLTRIGTIAADLKYTASVLGKNRSYANSDTSDDENYCPMDTMSPVVYNDEPESLFGKEIFQFKTHKKSGQMVLKAKDSCSPSMPKTKHSSAASSPQRTSKSRPKSTDSLK
uniref:Uncharacterized protein n=1 Tax=Arion vulgaris TaxID=1028688 RepID=A0A0B6ZSG8_9EUPU